jgi:hypothetical protein
LNHRTFAIPLAMKKDRSLMWGWFLLLAVFVGIGVFLVLLLDAIPPT